MSEIRSYPSIYAVGHQAAAELFDGPVVVEEKVDGSQFSFGIIDGELACRSKGKQIVLDAPDSMFEKAVAIVLEMAPDLTPGYVYRGEYFQKPKHNSLAYARIPNKHIILFDIDGGMEHFLNPDEKRTEAGRLGLEVVPVVYEGTLSSVEQLKVLLERESCLGAMQPEGLVIKNYAKFGPDKKTLMGKYVTEKFKETHRVQWKISNPSKADIIQRLIEVYRTDARWEKGVQHLRDAGTLDGSPKDIGPLLKEIPADVLKECREEIAAKLFEFAWPQIARGITAGVPQWYKDKLAASAFATAECEGGCA